MLSDYQRAVAELHEAFEEFDVLMHQEAQQLDQFQLTIQQEVLLQYVIRNQPITANVIASKIIISKSAVAKFYPNWNNYSSLNANIIRVIDENLLLY